VASIGIHAAFPESSSGDHLIAGCKKADWSTVPHSASWRRVQWSRTEAMGELIPGAAIGDSGCRDANRFRAVGAGRRFRLVPFCWTKLTSSAICRRRATSGHGAPKSPLRTKADGRSQLMRGLNARALPAADPLSFYQPVWNLTPVAAAKRGPWPRHDIPPRRRLRPCGCAPRQHGDDTIEILLGTMYRRISAVSYEIDTREAEDYRRVVQATGPVANVYYLGGLQMTREEFGTPYSGVGAAGGSTRPVPGASGDHAARLLRGHQ